MNLVQQVKKEISELKLMILDGENLTENDLITLKRSIEVMKDGIALSIFTEILDSKREDVLAELDAKIEHWKQEASHSSEKMDSLTINVKSNTSKIIESLISEIEDIKKDIIEVGPESLAEKFVKQKKNGQELVDSCSKSLAIGYMEFVRFFGKPLVEAHSNNSTYHDFTINKETIDEVFKIISDKSKMDEIRSYIDNERKLEKTREELAAYEYVCNGYNFASEHKSQIISYMTALSTLLRAEEREKQYQQLIDHDEYEMTYYESSNLFQKAINFSKYLENQKNIEMYKGHIAKNQEQIIQAREQVVEGQTLLINAGLGDIINILKKRLYVENGKVLFRIGDTVSKEVLAYDLFYGLNIEEKKQKYNSAREKATSEVEELTRVKNELLENMSLESKEYISNDYDTCERIVNLESAKERYNKTPIVCAYILKVLSDVKKIPWEDVMHMVSSKEVADELTSNYTRIITEYLSKKKEEVKSVEEIYSSTVEEEQRKRML